MMTLAFGTSTPTSTTDVATRTCVFPSENARRPSCFSSLLIFPWSIPKRTSGYRSRSDANSSSADLYRSKLSAVLVFTNGVMM